MTIYNKVLEIFAKYELKSLEFEGFRNLYNFLDSFPEKRNEYETLKNDPYFLTKYDKYISKGHYGFSIGTPIIPVWCEILDEILELCIDIDPTFQIQQIKLKWGRIEFNVTSQVIEDINAIDDLIYDKLNDEALIY